MTIVTPNGTTCDVQHDQHSFSSLTSPRHSIRYLTQGQSIGLAITAEASCVSFVCVVVILVLIGINILSHRKALQKADLMLLPADIFMLSLFMFDIIQAIGGILIARWVYDEQVRIGFYCSVQGIIKEIGTIGTSLITLILAVHTLVAALWGIGTKARGVAFGLVVFTCVFIALWVGLNNAIHKNFEAPAPYWCWISSRFQGERLAESVCLWTTLLVSVIVYPPLYLWAEGRLSIGDKWYEIRLFHPDQNLEYAQRRARLGMLFYPLAYSLVVLPLTIARWSHKYEKDIPSAALFFGQSTLNLSGAINVLLFIVIRPQLLFFRNAELEAQTSSGQKMGPIDSIVMVQCEPSSETKGGKVYDWDEKSSNFSADVRGF